MTVIQINQFSLCASLSPSFSLSIHSTLSVHFGMSTNTFCRLLLIAFQTMEQQQQQKKSPSSTSTSKSTQHQRSRSTSINSTSKMEMQRTEVNLSNRLHCHKVLLRFCLFRHVFRLTLPNMCDASFTRTFVRPGENFHHP